MMLLAIHVIAITLIVAVVGTIAYRRGVDRGEQRILRRLQRERDSSPEPPP